MRRSVLDLFAPLTESDCDETWRGAILGYREQIHSDRTQNARISCTKWVVEVDSPKPTLPWDQSADPPDSTCAQGIHLKLEASCKDWISTAATECQEQQDERLLENAEMGKDLEIGVPGIPDLEHDYPSEMPLIRVSQIRNLIEVAEQDYEKEKLNERIAKLSSGVMVVSTFSRGYPASVSARGATIAGQTNSKQAINSKELGPDDLGLKQSKLISLKRLGISQSAFTPRPRTDKEGGSSTTTIDEQVKDTCLPRTNSYLFNYHLPHYPENVLLHNNELRAVIEEGIVVGCGYTLLRLPAKVDAIKLTLHNDEQKVGADIVKRALSYPLKFIAKIVMEKVLSSDNFKYGYNITTGKYEDLMAAGIIDPTKVNYILKMSVSPRYDYQPLRLNGSNYLSWCTDIKLHLQTINVSKSIITDNTISESLRAHAMLAMSAHLEPELKLQHLYCGTPYELWTSLEERFGLQQALENYKNHNGIT
ncbi:hypothetical protein GIB67_002529 [Kingdonia uniflora]|uniref:Uncharacterized protein n=1 Tax=Kingdonia uniflora TaxID=39325 RepID=A0A7J7N918_9MAGN|nr:hypothetical protein GIB67_002529 [Kingdonia uniflora]